MLVIDSHLDVAMNALTLDRDLTQSIAAIRESEAGMGEKGRGLNLVSFPELRRADMGLIFATMFCRVAANGRRFSGVRTQDIAYAKDRGQLAYYRLMESRGILRQIRTRPELEAHLAAWDKDADTTPLGYILTMEGADGIVSEDQVPEWWGEGLAIASLCHYGISAWSHGTQAPGGLTERGPRLLAAMEQVGMSLDVSHLAEQAFWEALEVFGGAVLATHNCCRALCDHDRQFDDRQIRALADRGGVIGVAFDDWMLSPLWDQLAMDNTGITLETVADHLDHICQVTGKTDHAAIGSDLDGGYGKEQSPADMDTIADIQNLAGILEGRGYAAEDVAKVMHGNWIRFLQGALPA